MKPICLTLIALLLIISAAACSAPTTVAPTVFAPATTATSAPTAELPTATLPLPIPVPTSIPTTAAITTSAGCPEPTAGLALHISEANGWCFLYPEAMRLASGEPLPAHVTALEVIEPDPAQQEWPIRLEVLNNGPADGLDSARYAGRWLELLMPDAAPNADDAVIGGATARVLNELQGMMPQRAAFIVAGGIKYQVILEPRPEDAGAHEAEATLAWDTVTQSMRFFTPQNERVTVRPAEVCPTAAAGQSLVINELDGYCVVLPAGFAVDPDFPQRFIGGPELGPVADFGSVRSSLALAPFIRGGQTTAGLQPISEQIDPTSVVSVTIAGNPAVVYDFTGGPWRQRSAQILVGDSIYTIVAQPWDAAQFPQGIADIERLWQGVVDSLAFFTPWR